MISLIQTAEGALNETHAILQRMRELATQAANDTNTETDRGEIQKEINQLTSEINRIGNTTEFNTQKLLDGTKSVSGGGGGGATAAKITGASNYALTTTLSGKTASLTIKVDGTEYKINDMSSWDGTENETALLTLLQNADTVGDGTGTKLSTVANVTAADSKISIESKSTGGTSSVELTISGANANDVATLLGIESGASDTGSAGGGGGASGGISLQIGANQSQQFTVEINDMRAAALGIAGASGTSATGVNAGDPVSGAAFATTGNGNMTGTDYTTAGEQALDITDSTKASAAIKVIDQAIETVSAERSRLGAYQNRLEHTINNLSTSSENLTAAESRIRDVDYALAA